MKETPEAMSKLVQIHKLKYSLVHELQYDQEINEEIYSNE